MAVLVADVVTAEAQVPELIAPVPSADVPLAMVEVTPPLELRAFPRAVPTPVPRPDTPVDIGNPVMFVPVPDDGVPSAPPLVINAPAEPTLTPKAVNTPVPVPVKPVLIGRPVPFVSTIAEGVPSAGVINIGVVRVIFVALRPLGRVVLACSVLPAKLTTPPETAARACSAPPEVLLYSIPGPPVTSVVPTVRVWELEIAVSTPAVIVIEALSGRTQPIWVLVAVVQFTVLAAGLPIGAQVRVLPQIISPNIPPKLTTPPAPVEFGAILMI